jgi:hypothetical protein
MEDMDKLAVYASEAEHLLEDAERNPFGDKIPALTWAGEQLAAGVA